MKKYKYADDLSTRHNVEQYDTFVTQSREGKWVYLYSFIGITFLSWYHVNRPFNGYFNSL